VPSTSELRRKINFQFINKIETSSQAIKNDGDGEAQSLSDAKKSKKKKSK
jgi:hypothetical protein